MDGRARAAAARAAAAAGAAPSTARPSASRRCWPARDAALACEELTLRARGDLDRGREREAALQLEAALAAALAELAGWREHRRPGERVDELAGYAAGRGRRVRGARGRWTGDVEAVTAALARLEAALRARAMYAAE